MIVGNLNFGWTFGGPYEADTKLVVDPNVVLSLAIASEGLQTISRRRAKISELGRSVEHIELASGLLSNAVEPFYPLAVVAPPTGFVSEASDHSVVYITRYV